MISCEDDMKQAKTGYPVMPAIEARWSPRAFNTARPVELEKLGSLLEAARWAASSYNEQPWRFIVGNKYDSPRTHEMLQDVLVDGNRWAKEVPILILTVAKNHFTQSGGLNRHAFHDVGLTMANLTLQAQHEGLHAHLMAGFCADTAYRLFNIPQEDYTPCVMAAVGYLGAPETLTEEWQRNAEYAPRYRKPLQDIVYSETWGQPYSGCFT